MSEKVTYQGTLRLADEFGITPVRCGGCSLTPSSGLSFSSGRDDHRDPQWVGYQCNSCGYAGNHMTRAQILRRIKIEEITND